MLKRDLESIKCLINPLYQSTFEIKWNDLSLQEKQELMMSYIDTIEVEKKADKLKIKRINFRKTFIEEYANLFNNGAINRFQDVTYKALSSEIEEVIQLEVCAPMTRPQVNEHLKRLQINYPVDYQELPKEQLNEKQFCLKYEPLNNYNEPFKMIPLINKKGLTKVTHYGLIEVPIPPINYIVGNVDLKEVLKK